MKSKSLCVFGLFVIFNLFAPSKVRANCYANDKCFHTHSWATGSTYCCDCSHKKDSKDSHEIVEAFAQELDEAVDSSSCDLVGVRCKSACNYPKDVQSVICYIDCMKKGGCL